MSFDWRNREPPIDWSKLTARLWRLPQFLDRQLDRYLLAIRQKRDATGVVCLAIALQLIDNQEKFSLIRILPQSPAQSQFNIPAVGNAPKITVTFDADAIEAIPAVYRVVHAHLKNFYSMVLQAYPVAWKWIVQLTACNQVHKLTDIHVANYFKHFPDFKNITSFNGYEVDGKAVLPYLKFCTGAIKWPQSDGSQTLAANDEIRATFLSDSNFVKRHTTYSASAEICRELIDELGTHVNKFEIDEEMIEAVDQSLANYWDQELNAKIPVKLIAMAATYAQFRGKGYGNWFQGKKAVYETLPSGSIEIWQHMFQSLLK
jgi:hypothetical protein